MSITVTKIVNTCTACPAQWDLELSDGRKLYVRYRHGGFSVTDVTANPLLSDPDLCDISFGDPLDGYMNEEQMLDLVQEHVLDFMNNEDIYSCILDMARDIRSSTLSAYHSDNDIADILQSYCFSKKVIDIILAKQE